MWGPPVSPFSPSLFLSVFLPVTYRVGAGELAPAPPWPPPPPRCCPRMRATPPETGLHRPSLYTTNPSWPPPLNRTPSSSSCPPPPWGFCPCPLLEKRRGGGKKKGGAQEAGRKPGGPRFPRRRPGAAAGRHVCVAEQETPPPLHPLRCALSLRRVAPRRCSPPWSRRTALH
jgi:hypothetical protein